MCYGHVGNNSTQSFPGWGEGKGSIENVTRRGAFFGLISISSDRGISIFVFLFTRRRRRKKLSLKKDPLSLSAESDRRFSVIYPEYPRYVCSSSSSCLLTISRAISSFVASASAEVFLWSQDVMPRISQKV